MTTADNAAEQLIAQAQKTFTVPFAGVIKLAPNDQPPVWINGHTNPPTIGAHEPKDRSCDCVWRGGGDTVLRALESEKALESDYLSGRIFISGDMSVMVRLTMKAGR